MKNRLLFTGLLTCLLWACASNRANVNYDTSIDFQGYKTYAWTDKTDPKTEQSKIDSPLVHKQVQRSIVTALNVQGFKPVDVSLADILIRYHLSMAVVGSSGSSISFGIGSYGYRSSVGLAVGIPLDSSEIEEGTLAIDIIDAKTNSVVWQGIASTPLSRGSSAEETPALIDTLVNDILSQYPPKKGQ